jgi:hypothetical protein
LTGRLNLQVTRLFKNAFFISGRISLDLFCPLAHVIKVLDADPAVIIMDAGHDIIATLQEEWLRKGEVHLCKLFTQK